MKRIDGHKQSQGIRELRVFPREPQAEEMMKTALKVLFMKTVKKELEVFEKILREKQDKFAGHI